MKTIKAYEVGGKIFKDKKSAEKEEKELEKQEHLQVSHKYAGSGTEGYEAMGRGYRQSDRHQDRLSDRREECLPARSSRGDEGVLWIAPAEVQDR